MTYQVEPVNPLEAELELLDQKRHAINQNIIKLQQDLAPLPQPEGRPDDSLADEVKRLAKHQASEAGRIKAVETLLTKYTAEYDAFTGQIDDLAIQIRTAQIANQIRSHRSTLEYLANKINEHSAETTLAVKEAQGLAKQIQDLNREAKENGYQTAEVMLRGLTQIKAQWVGNILLIKPEKIAY
jgi:chromosome segregation ATPase